MRCSHRVMTVRKGSTWYKPFHDPLTLSHGEAQQACGVSCRSWARPPQGLPSCMHVITCQHCSLVWGMGKGSALLTTAGAAQTVWFH